MVLPIFPEKEPLASFFDVADPVDVEKLGNFFFDLKLVKFVILVFYHSFKLINFVILIFD